MARRGDRIYKVSFIAGLSILALVPFAFFLINSLSPTHINGLSLAKVTGQFFDPDTNQSIKVQVRAGPSGGCVWSNITFGTAFEITTCNSHIPYKPTTEQLHLPSNSKIPSCFPIAIGKALNLNHVTTALMGFSVVAILIDILILNGGFSSAIIYFTVFFMWMTFIFETTYISVLHRRLDNIGQFNDDAIWTYKVGEGYWFILAATVLVSLFTCGGGFSLDND